VSLTNPFTYLQRNADDDPRGVFAQSADGTTTNAEALVMTKKIAYELRRLGVTAGQVVALDLPDPLGILFTEALYHEAAISTVLPDRYPPEGGVHVDWMFSNRGQAAARPGARLVEVDAALLRNIEQNPYGIRPSETPVEVLRIVFSSGTTGRPKAIALGAAMDRMMDAAIPSFFRNAPNLTLMDTGTARGIGEFFLSVKAGVPYLCAGGALPPALVRLAERSSPRVIKGSPNQVLDLVAELEAQSTSLSGVETVVVSGTSMPLRAAERARRVMGGCRVVQNYGSTEAGGATSRSYDSDDPFDAGHPVPGTVIEIVDERDLPLPEGTVGRIRYRTPGMAQGYAGDAEATSAAFKDGWFYPGDRGAIRQDGGLTLAGRESEILNAGGVKVDPNRIDHVALGLPGVMDACSFEYVARSGLAQVGLALVVGEDFDVDAALRRLEADFGVAGPKLVARIDRVPRTATGKPLRRELAERYREA
jgi:long-chain acyl-CoA synthetase